MNYVQIQYEKGTSVIEMDFFSASMTRGQEREQKKINNFAAFALGIVTPWGQDPRSGAWFWEVSGKR